MKDYNNYKMDSNVNGNSSTNNVNGDKLSNIKSQLANSIKKDPVPYYPLPSNEGYEKFLQTMKKDICIKFILKKINKLNILLPFF